MANNRFDRPGNYDFSMQHYVPQEFIPNFEAWGATLGQYQQEKDVTEALASKAPNAISQDVATRDKYVQDNAATIDKLTDLYTSGTVSQARGEQAKFLKQLGKDYAPGGKAAQLESRYNQYNEMVKTYKKKFEKDPAMMMRYTMAAINKGITPGALHESIGDPNVGAYVDIKTKLDKLADGFKPNGNTQIQVTKDGKWYDTIQKRYVTEAEVAKYSQQMLRTPEFREQLKVEVWNMGQNVSDEAALESYENRRVMEKKNVEAMYDNMSARQIQQMAKKQGIDVGAVDGIDGKLTAAARKQMKEAELAKIDGKVFDKGDYLMQSLEESYINPVVDKYAFMDTKISRKHDPYRLAATKAHYKKSLLDHVMLQSRGTQEYYVDGKQMKINNTDLNTRIKEARSNLKEANKGLTEGLNNPDGTIGPVTSSNAAYAMAAYERSKRNGVRDEDAFITALPTKLQNKGKEMFRYMNSGSNAEWLSSQLNHISNIETTLDMDEKIRGGIAEKYISSDDGKAYMASQYKDYVSSATNKGDANIMSRGQFDIAVDKARQSKLEGYQLETGQSTFNAFVDNTIKGMQMKIEEVEKKNPNSDIFGYAQATSIVGGEDSVREAQDADMLTVIQSTDSNALLDPMSKQPVSFEVDGKTYDRSEVKIIKTTSSSTNAGNYHNVTFTTPDGKRETAIVEISGPRMKEHQANNAYERFTESMYTQNDPSSKDVMNVAGLEYFNATSGIGSDNSGRKIQDFKYDDELAEDKTNLRVFDLQSGQVLSTGNTHTNAYDLNNVNKITSRPVPGTRDVTNIYMGQDPRGKRIYYYTVQKPTNADGTPGEEVIFTDGPDIKPFTDVESLKQEIGKDEMNAKVEAGHASKKTPTPSQTLTPSGAVNIIN